MIYIFSIIISYLLGSIPMGLLLTKLAGKGDLRKVGSGNIGATNVMRVGGLRMAGLVWLLDMAKAIAAVFIGKYVAGDAFGAWCGFVAIVGHCYPIWLKFKGGKGVATMCGVLLAIHPFAVLICTAIFCVVLAFTKYVSVSVIAAVTCFPFLVNTLFALWLDPKETLVIKIFSIVAGCTIWLCHISNLKRLYHGKEEKFEIKKPLKEKSCPLPPREEK